jgi:hypothetical protein
MEVAVQQETTGEIPVIFLELFAMIIGSPQISDFLFYLWPIVDLYLRTNVEYR